MPPHETRILIDGYRRRAQWGDLGDPDNRRRVARWVVERKVSRHEQLTEDADALVERMVAALRPAWSDRIGAIRTACIEALKRSAPPDPDRLHEEAETLFELFAASDRCAPELLAAIDAGAAQADEQVTRIRDMAAAARKLQDEPPTPPGQVRDVA